MELEEADSSIDYLFNMFGGVVGKDVIKAVVENCAGDTNLSIDALLGITNDTKPDQSTNQTMVHSEENVSGLPNPQSQIENSKAAEPLSYTDAFKHTGAVPKRRTQQHASNSSVLKPDKKFDKIIDYHKKGFCILILLRGAPGSGKTYLAQKLIKTMIGDSVADFKTHICSADDYFMFGGQYHFDKNQLSEAHQWNQKRALLAMDQRLSPVIVDNTNVELWEMEPYVKSAVANGYFIEVIEPDTPWAKKANLLFRRNVHNVPFINIKRMLENYNSHITTDNIMEHFGLSYPLNRTPPTIRLMPVYQVEDQNLTVVQEQVSAIAITKSPKVNVVKPDNLEQIPMQSNDNIDEEQKSLHYAEIEKQLQQYAKVEQEWESGENWDAGNTPNAINDAADNVTPELPKPPRQNNYESSNSSLMKNISNCVNWQEISMFMPSWENDSSPAPLMEQSKVADKVSSSTCMELGDFNNEKNIFKVISTFPRDINEFHMPLDREKIPENRMLDKSSMTNENILTNRKQQCENKDKHFKELRKLFKNVSKTALQDIFDQCFGDPNWAVAIILEGISQNNIETIDAGDIISDEEMEPDDGNDCQCSCLDPYNILPEASTDATVSDANDSILDNNTSPPQSEKKIKRINNKSADSLILKRMIEQNVGFSDNYYSEHCLKIRKFRRGEHEYPQEKQEQASAVDDSSAAVCDVPNSFEPLSTQESCDAPVIENNLSDDEDSFTLVDEVDKTVDMDVGEQFITAMDNALGRNGMRYPTGVAPKIRIPKSLLYEINALWMESLMYQLDEADKPTHKMLREDEEFARKLELKEAELALSGAEPAIPDFKEIMDMDFALSLYQKDVAEWRNKEPNDLAAKLTRDKLYNLFPDVAKETLSELLMAHDNNFQSTVEVLLMSTGQGDVLNEQNGLNKYVMKKEMERKEKILEEEKKALSEVEWPLLPRGEVVDMSVVEQYRSEATRHLNSRNVNYMKANDYIRRGMVSVASYYNDLAVFHKLKYEQASSMAAVSLIQMHASNTTDAGTIDLHYLRVSEARETLDLFLDTHIQDLQEAGYRSTRNRALFIITGRGLHSNGRPKLKPAVQKRLEERGLPCRESNPGLLATQIHPEAKMAYQVP